jgi:type IV secretion system protein VirD4
MHRTLRTRTLTLRPLARITHRALPAILCAAAAACVLLLLARLPGPAAPAPPPPTTRSAATHPGVGTPPPRDRRRPLGILLAATALAAGTVALLKRRDRARRTALHSTAHGTARWGTPDHLLRPAGFILGRHHDRLLRYRGETHLLTIAPTGSGKGVGAVLPNLLDYPGSILVTDIKGENHAVTARYRRTALGQPIAALDPFGLVGGTARYNPLDLIDPQSPDAYDLARLLATTLVVPELDRHEPFWDDEAASLLTAMILHVTHRVPPPHRHLGTVRSHLSLGEAGLHNLLDDMTRTDACHGLLRMAANRIRQKEPRLLANVLASTHRHTELLDSPNLLATLTTSTFQMADLKRRPQTLYLILPPHHLHSHGRWLRLLIASALRVLTATPGQPQHNVLLLLDEFPVLGRLPAVEEAIAYARSYGITIWMLIQDLSQLRQVYRTSWETLLANTRIKQAFGTADEATADYLSRLTGQATVRVESHNLSRGSTTSRGWLPQRQHGLAHHLGETGRRLLLPDEIRRLPANRQLLFLSGHPPLLTARLDYRHHPTLAPRADPNPLYRPAAGPAHR